MGITVMFREEAKPALALTRSTSSLVILSRQLLKWKAMGKPLAWWALENCSE